MRRAPAAAGLSVLALLAACDEPVERPAAAPAAPAAYASTQGADASGYYLPAEQVRIGNWRLDRIFMGQPADFDRWEAGERDGGFAPLMIEFSDVTSPTQVDELGGEGHAVTARVLPTAYAVSDGRVRFEGRSTALGAVTFDGRLDQDALATAKRNLGDEGAVLTGTLKAGGESRRVALRWWMGD